MRHLNGSTLSVFLFSVGAVLEVYSQTKMEKKETEWCLEGRVTDVHTKTAISGASVFVFREDTRSTVSNTQTNGDGYFALKGTQTGELRLFGDAPCYLRTEYGSTSLCR